MGVGPGVGEGPSLPAEVGQSSSGEAPAHLHSMNEAIAEDASAAATPSPVNLETSAAKPPLADRVTKLAEGRAGPFEAAETISEVAQKVTPVDSELAEATAGAFIVQYLEHGTRALRGVTAATPDADRMVAQRASLSPSEIKAFIDEVVKHGILAPDAEGQLRATYSALLTTALEAQATGQAPAPGSVAAEYYGDRKPGDLLRYAEGQAAFDKAEQDAAAEARGEAGRPPLRPSEMRMIDIPPKWYTERFRIGEQLPAEVSTRFQEVVKGLDAQREALDIKRLTIDVEGSLFAFAARKDTHFLDVMLREMQSRMEALKGDALVKDTLDPNKLQQFLEKAIAEGLFRPNAEAALTSDDEEAAEYARPAIERQAQEHTIVSDMPSEGLPIVTAEPTRVEMPTGTPTPTPTPGATSGSV